MNMFNEITKLQRLMETMYKEIYQPAKYDPLDFIKVDDAGEMVLVFNNSYFWGNNPSKLRKVLKVHGMEISAAQFNNWRDKRELSMLFGIGVTMHYVKKIPGVDYYICSDGMLLTKNLYAIGINSTMSIVNIVANGEEYRVNRAKWVIKSFIDEEYDEDKKKAFFKNGNYFDCGVNNVEIQGYTKR